MIDVKLYDWSNLDRDGIIHICSLLRKKIVNKKNKAKEITKLFRKHFKENEIPLYGIQTNPEQSSWTSSPKAFCHLYIDDAALGCPLVSEHRDFVDWVKVREMLVKRKIIL